MDKTSLVRITSASITCALALLLPVRSASAEGLTDGEGQPYDLRSLRGQVVVLTFGSPATREELARINLMLEAQVRPRDVAVVSVIDFSTIPGLFHGYARRQVADSQRTQRVKLLVDERGSVRQPLRVLSDRVVHMLVLDRQGAVRGRFRGERELSEVLRLTAELRQTAPPQAVAMR
jgi:hypothetical protein